jgi:hypothetical protein
MTTSYRSKTIVIDILNSLVRSGEATYERKKIHQTSVHRYSQESTDIFFMELHTEVLKIL